MLQDQSGMPVRASCIKRLVKSFGYAFNGLCQLVKSEQNARIHLAATIVVVSAGFYTGINRYEWMAVCLSVALVWGAEACNTAIEKLVDFVSPARHPKAGMIKDIAAGGVLACAIIAFVIALLVFVPKIASMSGLNFEH